LVIDGAFEHSHPGITAQFRALRDTCPRLFDTILPRSKRFQPPSAREDDANDDEEGIRSIEADGAYGSPALYSRVQARYYAKVLGLPVKAA